MGSMKKNMATSIVFKVVTILTNLIVQHRVLVSFGSDINGVTSSVSQFISYLVLLEAGIGAASIQALYRPIAEGNWDETNAIISATNRQYRKISFIFLTLLFGLSCLMPLIVSQQLDAILVGAITFLAGLSSFFTFLFTGRYNVLLNADKRINVVYTVDSALSIVSCCARIMAIRFGYGIIVVQSILAIVALSKAIILSLYVKRRYKKLNLKAEPDFSKISKHKNVLVHQIAGIVVNHTDVTILTVASTLKTVSVYSVYNYIYSNLSSIITTTFSQAAQATFGHLSAKSQDEYNEFYSTYEFFFGLLLYIVLVTALIMTLPFVSLYTKGVTDINYISRSIAVLFFADQIMNLIRIPSLVTIQSYGWFKETQRGAIIEAVINISVSLALLPFLGMRGLLIGTLCSYAYRTQDVIVYVYRRCGLKWAIFVKNNVVNLFIAVLLVIYFFFFRPIQVTSWIGWIVYSALTVMITAIAFVLPNYLLNKKLFKKGLQMIVNKRTTNL